MDPDTLVRESSARDVIEGECAFMLKHKLSYELIIALHQSLPAKPLFNVDLSVVPDGVLGECI